MNGLKRLEYRGYDSAGIATIEHGAIEISKRAGKVADLEKIVNPTSLTSTIGIGHTRWATHGEPNNINAHPHTDFSGNITLIHNGIIENYLAIKKKLLIDGYSFKSDTDSEVLAVFIGDLYKRTNDLETAVRLALTEIDGTFGLVVMSIYEPNTLIAARRGSPIVFGIGEGEYIIASDASAIIQHTRQVIYLNDNEMVVINRDSYTTKTIDNQATNGIIHELEFDLKSIEKGGFEHFMLKEIYEQPSTFRDAIRGRLLIEDGNVKLGGLRVVADKLRNAKRLIIIGCGTSWHSGLVGEYMIERLAQIPVEVEYASEFRYRSPIIYPDDIVIAISQSGETADTYAALREAKLKGATVLGIVNVVGSSIARETDAGVYAHAGPEIGVASTKAFTSQLAVLSLIALYLGRLRNVSSIEGKRLAEAIAAIPEKIQYILDHADTIRAIAKEYAHAQNFLYLGRGYNFPVALEGALKLKEISYIHAEGYPAAEMKHGPIALIDDNMPVVFIATKDEVYDKILSGIEEVRARKGKVIAIASEGDTQIAKVASHVIYVPNTLPMLMPILSVIPLQLLAYYTAVERGCDVDMPRNLAKSVTVE
jgi:glucosamine--fructose-6-phosphate aminotransferase (isomerizing)